MDTSHLAAKFGSASVAIQASPAHQVESDLPPSIIFYGTADATYLPGAVRFHERAKKLKLNTEFYLANNQKHGFFNNPPFLDSTLLLADQFLIKHGYLTSNPTVTPDGGQMYLRE